jgi:hypothetical protein
MYKFSLLIFWIAIACTHKPAESVKSDLKPFDTVFYSLNQNERTERFVDSMLTDYNVMDCSFKFSMLFDSLRISFSVTESPEDLTNKISSNRFLLLKGRRIKVVSDEDFFIQLNKPSVFINSHPDRIYFILRIPGFEIIDMYRYPPE